MAVDFQSEQRPSSGLSLNLASNNPFRRHAESPLSTPGETSLRSPFSDPYARPNTGHVHNRPVSRNPFLDSTDAYAKQPPASLSRPLSRPPPNSTMFPATGGSGPDQTAVNNVAGPLSNFSINSQSSSNGAENFPANLIDVQGGPPPAGHRITRSEQDAMRGYQNGPVAPSTGSAQPPRDENANERAAENGSSRESRPYRRNSESSLMGTRSGNLLHAEGRRQKEARQKDAKNRDGKPREGAPSSSTKPKKPNQRLDIIDKLDVTSIYGTGLFHHDGPFDACNPHRNRKGSRRAPMQAFAKDSANNAIGGSGPLRKDMDRELYYGDRGAEAFSDYSRSGKDAVSMGTYGDRVHRPAADRSQSFDPMTRVDPVHGDESLGLGTSTFLEGAPASRTAMQRRESDSEGGNLKSGGLGRKLSLAQKIRGLNQNRHVGPSGRVASPDARYDPLAAGPMTPREGQAPYSPSGGEGRKPNERNPFFNEYDSAYDKKGESIAVVERGVSGPGMEPMSPRKNLTRHITNGSVGNGAEESKPSGFLSRVKSLRGGRKAR